ncbi:zinc ribbon domain-containing protein [Micromonospora sediminicola]|uniref:zinc ribbon domain-containing protein n=1 Tax=Micromonospora sediminicola TaxID=946078 RepID=UPI0033F670F8
MGSAFPTARGTSPWWVRLAVGLVDERGTSSTCPVCHRRVPKPRGRSLSCPHCTFSGRRDLVAAASIATRSPGGGPTTPRSRRAARGAHAPSSRPAPARCRPVPA